MFDVHPSTVRYWAKSGVIDCIITPGGQNKIPEDAIDKFRFSSEHFDPAFIREQKELEKMKKQLKAAKVEHQKWQQEKIRRKIAKLKVESVPDKDQEIRKMLLAGKHNPEKELVLKTSSARISKVSKSMKEVPA